MSWNDPFRRRSRRESGGSRRDTNGDDNQEDDWMSPFDFDFKLGFGEIDRMIENMFKTAVTQAKENSSAFGPMYYGYSVTIGPDGKPHVREFGNVKPAGKGRVEVGAREPFVDTVVNDKDSELKIIAEMPGVQKEDIRLEALEDSLRISAERGDRRYETTVPLNQPVDPSTAKASYNNGVLEVKMKTKGTPKPKGVNITIE